MADIRRNRTVLASAAAIAIILGLLLVGQGPRPPASAPRTTGEAPSSPGEGFDAQAEKFEVRDYADFSQGPDADLISSDWIGLLVGMGGKLALVIALLYLAAVILRRYLYRGGAGGSAKKPLSLLASLNLSPNRTVYILEVGRKVLVVGATQSQLSLLTEVTDPEAVDEVRALSTETPSVGQFPSLLNVASRKFGTWHDSSTDAPVVDPLQIKIREGRDFVQGKLADIRRSLERAEG